MDWGKYIYVLGDFDCCFDKFFKLPSVQSSYDWTDNSFDKGYSKELEKK